MKRRQFIATAGALSFGTLALTGCSAEQSWSSNGGRSLNRIEKLGGMSLEEHREKYRRDLFDHYLPNMDRYVVDHDLGGFMCAVDIRTGEQVNSSKRAWYEGRGMWAYSFLYNNLDPNPHYLEIARKSKDFILPKKPRGKEFYVSSFSKEGEPLAGPGDIYGNLFVAEGLQEYARASGEMNYYDEAKSIILSCWERYNEPDYAYRPEGLGLSDTRVLGHWMIFLRLVTQMLEYRADPQLEEIATRSVEAVLDRHIHPDYRLGNEYLNHDFSLPENEYRNYSNTGHSIETFWMIMFEAARRNDRRMFERARDAFKRHIAVARDAVYGGFFHELRHVDNYEWNVSKVLWIHEEILIGTLFLIEHTGDPWAVRVFEETDAHIREVFRKPGYKFWTSGGDRTLTQHNTTRAENYHHPRHLMLNLMAVERMLERNGEPDGLFV